MKTDSQKADDDLKFLGVELERVPPHQAVEASKQTAPETAPQRIPYTLAELETRRRVVNREIIKAKMGSPREKRLVEILAEIDHAVAARQAATPARSALPLKKQRELGMIPPVKAPPCPICKDTGINQNEHCDGRLTGIACDCQIGKSLMERHYETHPEEKPHTCPECAIIGREACPEHGNRTA